MKPSFDLIKGNNIKRFSRKDLFPYDELWDPKNLKSSKLNLFYNLDDITGINDTGATSIVFSVKKRSLDECIRLHKEILQEKFPNRKINEQDIRNKYKQCRDEVCVKLINDIKDNFNEARLLFFNLDKDFIRNAEKHNLITILLKHPCAIKLSDKNSKINFRYNASQAQFLEHHPETKPSKYTKSEQPPVLEELKKYRINEESSCEIGKTSLNKVTAFQEKIYPDKETAAKEARLSAYFCMPKITGPNMHGIEITKIEDSLLCLAFKLESLKYMHDHNIVHRDSNPGNSILDPKEDKVYSIDLGLGRKIGDIMPNKALTAKDGNPKYASVKQLERDSQKLLFDPSDDLYSIALGFSSYALGLSCRNFTGEKDPLNLINSGTDFPLKLLLKKKAISQKILSLYDQPKSPQQEAAAEDLQDLLLNMLETDPQKRPNVRTVIKDLKNIMSKFGIKYPQIRKSVNYNLQSDYEGIEKLNDTLEKFQYDYRLYGDSKQKDSLDYKLYSLNTIIQDQIDSHENIFSNDLEDDFHIIKNVRSLFPSLTEDSACEKLSEKVDYESILSKLKNYYQEQSHLNRNIESLKIYSENPNILKIFHKSTELDKLIRSNQKGFETISKLEDRIKEAQKYTKFLVKLININERFRDLGLRLYQGSNKPNGDIKAISFKQKQIIDIINRTKQYKSELKEIEAQLSEYDKENNSLVTSFNNLEQRFNKSKENITKLKEDQKLADDIDKKMEEYSSLLESLSHSLQSWELDYGNEWRVPGTLESNYYSNLSLEQLGSKPNDPVKAFTRAYYLPHMPS